jgi:fumarate reductase flavoprotein subunit
MAYKIVDRCVCCHSCATNCPVEAITFQGSQYWIDPEKCISCGTCAQLCPQSIIEDMDAPKTAPAPHEKRELSCDLCVLGAGGSGLVAAVRFAQKTGKKVIVLEKGKKCGGSTNFAHNWFTGYNRWHKEAGVPDQTDKLLEYCIREAQGCLPDSLVEKVLRNTGNFFEWLVDFDEKEARECFAIGRGPMGALGIDYPDRKFENLKCHDPAIGPGWAGTYLIRKMLQVAPSLGVEVYTEHEAVELLKDGSGKITGVLAKDPGGETEVHAKAVVLATGGFSGNDEKLKKREPGFFDGGIPVHRFSPVTCSGDGMDLAEQVGGWVNMKKTKLNKFGPVHHPYTASGCGMAGFGAMMVDFRGKLQEMPMGPMGDTSFLDNIPEHAIWYIVPGKTVEKNLRDSVEHPREGNHGMTYEDYRAEIDFELRSKGPAYCGDTIEELAKKLGMDPKVLQESIDTYNESLKEDKPPMMPFMEDEDGAGNPSFHNEDTDGDGGPGLPPPPPSEPILEGPYYAFLGQRFAEGAFGGVMTNEDVEVIREDGSVIPGLYAVGDAASTWYTRGVLGPLTELTWAVNSGYFAADSAEKYLA